MKNDSSNSLIDRALHGALALFGIAALLWVVVDIVRHIWISLAVITLAALAIMLATTLIIRWHNQNRM